LRNEPALRFDLFQDDYRLTNIGRETKKVLSGRTPDKNNSSIWGDEIPWITSGDIHQKYITSGDLYLNENSVKNLGLHLIPKHSVLIGTAGQGKTRCTVGTNERELCTNDAMLSMIPKNDVYYLYLLFLLEGKYQHLRLLTPQETKTRLSTNNLKSFMINLPSLDEQKKVADFVFSVEKKILLLEKKLENLKLFKIGLTSKLFNHNNWGEMQIGDLVDYEQPTKYRTTNIEKEKRQLKTPVLTANKSFLLGYTSDLGGIYTKGDVILFDDFTTLNKYVNFSFKVKSSALKILTPKEGVNLKFVYESIQHIDFNPESHKRHYISEYQFQYVKVPSKETQDLTISNVTNINSKITYIEEKLENLKQFNRHSFVLILYNVSNYTLEVSKNE
jgi:type I restriction enzyme S subunit